MRYGADIDKCNRFNETALSCACRMKHLPAVKLLLKKGANPNAVDKSLASPLRWAAEYQDEEMMAVLLRHGASVTQDAVQPTKCALTTLEDKNSEIALRIKVSLQEALLSEKKTVRATLAHVEHQLKVKHADAIEKRIRVGIQNGILKRKNIRAFLAKEIRDKRIQSYVDRCCSAELTTTMVANPKMSKRVRDNNQETESLLQWVKTGKGKWKQMRKDDETEEEVFVSSQYEKNMLHLKKMRDIWNRVGEEEGDILKAPGWMSPQPAQWKMLFGSLGKNPISY